MKADIKCVSTGQKIANDIGSVTFKCPQCGDYEIVRSEYARVIAAPYKCPKCSFEGPN
ncbi:DUF1610 domain-containing protein [Candidatus Woesearchaeota archaeon]|nr:DUF1610 domain-containing protein [Candidatus Woesearchaeota archaeon]